MFDMNELGTQLAFEMKCYPPLLWRNTIFALPLLGNYLTAVIHYT